MYIRATQCRKFLIFQTMNSVRPKSLSFHHINIKGLYHQVSKKQCLKILGVLFLKNHSILTKYFFQIKSFHKCCPLGGGTYRGARATLQVGGGRHPYSPKHVELIWTQTGKQIKSLKRKIKLLNKQKQQSMYQDTIFFLKKKTIEFLK